MLETCHHMLKLLIITRFLLLTKTHKVGDISYLGSYQCSLMCPFLCVTCDYENDWLLEVNAHYFSNSQLIV